MYFLLENTEQRVKFANNSRNLIVTRYEQSYVWNELLNKYNSILSKLYKNV